MPLPAVPMWKSSLINCLVAQGPARTSGQPGDPDREFTRSTTPLPGGSAGLFMPGPQAVRNRWKSLLWGISWRFFKGRRPGGGQPPSAHGFRCADVPMVAPLSQAGAGGCHQNGQTVPARIQCCPPAPGTGLCRRPGITLFCFAGQRQRCGVEAYLGIGDKLTGG